MECNFKYNSWHAWFYLRTYDECELPDDLCPYSWKLFIATICLPLTFGGYAFKNWAGNANSITIKPLYTMLLVFATAMAFIIGEEFVPNSPAWLVGLVGIGFFLSAMLLFVVMTLIFAGVFTLVDKIREFHRIKQYRGARSPSSDNLFVAKFKSWKGKYCPKINWE